MFRQIDLGADRIVRGFQLVFGCYPYILVFDTGNNGHYCAETCRPYFTQLMSVRREGESVDYRVGFLSLSQRSLEIVFFWVFQLLILGLGCVHSREAVVWFCSRL